MVALLVFVSLAAVGLCKPPPYVREESIYENLPYLVDRFQLARGEEVTHYDTLVALRGWPQSHYRFGQISGVDTDSAGDVHIFNRAERAWNGQSFGPGNVIRHEDPIQGDTVVILDQKTGEVQRTWGSNMFYMPHSLTIDHEDNTWLTDVGLHQVLKFPKGSENASLVLGTALSPGHDDTHFCKPTDVAVASNGVFFVSDGYCNSRVMKFSPDGTLLGQFGRTEYSLESQENDNFHIPHSIALIESRDILCVADRENGRIQCFNAGLRNSTNFGSFVKSVKDNEFSKVYAITYDPNRQLMYAVNGPNRDGQAIQGFTIDTRNWQVVDSWGPQAGFAYPHDVAVSPNGKHVYVTEIGPNRVWKMAATRL